MMNNLKETTNYIHDFDPECYMKNHYSGDIGLNREGGLIEFNLDTIHNIFDSGKLNELRGRFIYLFTK